MKELFSNLTEKDFFKNANLHIHSTFSDGHVKFEELILQAKKIGLKVFSITDHNTLEGYKSLKTLPSELVSGVEFDCYMDFNLPHILGYGVDVNSEELNKLTAKYLHCDIIRIFQLRNPKKVIDAIHKAGGIAVLAHPCCYWCSDLEKFVHKLVKMGLDGIEVYYPYDRITRFLKFHSRKEPCILAEKFNLIKTGGTDCHTSLFEVINA